MLSDRDPSVADYPRLPGVVDRVREFCGLTPGGTSRCLYLAGMGAAGGPYVTWRQVSMREPEALDELLAAGDDIARSLWDTGSLLVYVDLDYLNADSAGEAYLHPADCFLKLEPAYRGLCAVFDALGMPMLDLVTGAGYGFVGRIPLAGRAVARLASLAHEVPPWHRTHARRRPIWAAASISENEAKAYQGLGLVLEHVAHRVLVRAAATSAIPIVMNNTEVGMGPTGRECASIDLTHMGDPLDARHLRVAFGLYQKHRLRPDLTGAAAARMAPLVVLPRSRRTLMDMLEQGRGLRQAAMQAARMRVAIPVVEEGALRMLDDYAASGLARWHREYYGVRPHPPEAWSETYGRFDPAGLPACAAACLEYPNDLLLRPGYVQLLVRILLARGWHARHIAGLVHAYYSRPDIWGDHWRSLDPETWADFQVRVFAGLVADGCDRGIDFNCVSTKEKRMCPGRGCGIDLRRERDRLLARGSS